MMTNDEVIAWPEAIKVKYIHGGDEGFDAKRKEALDLAIEALKENEKLSLLYSDMANEIARLKSMTGER